MEGESQSAVERVHPHGGEKQPHQAGDKPFVRLCARDISGDQDPKHGQPEVFPAAEFQSEAGNSICGAGQKDQSHQRAEGGKRGGHNTRF